MAVVDLTYGGIGGTKVRNVAHAPLMFKLQILIMMILHKLSAGLVPMPALLRIQKGDASVSYSTLSWQNKIEKYLTHGAVVAAIGLGLRHLS